MVGLGEGAFVPEKFDAPRVVRSPGSINWSVAILMMSILIAAVVGVVVALASGMPTVAILIALVTGAVFAGKAC